MKIKKYYQESGKSDIKGLILSYFVALVIAILLGYIYSITTTFMPIIYVNMLFTIGVGVIIGYIVRVLVRIGKIRNHKQKLILAGVFGLFVVYFQWVAYIIYIVNDKFPDFITYVSNINLFTKTTGLIDIISIINSTGAWNVSGITIKGTPLTLIWIAEALIIIIGAIKTIHSVNIYPFSDFLNKWYTKYTFDKDFTSKISKKELKEDVVTYIQNLDYGGGMNHVKIHLYYLKDENHQYLSFEHFFATRDGKTKSNFFIKNYKIDKKAAETLIENFKNKRQRISIF